MPKAIAAWLVRRPGRSGSTENSVAPGLLVGPFFGRSHVREIGFGIPRVS